MPAKLFPADYLLRTLQKQTQGFKGLMRQMDPQAGFA
jgi:hypothetical protein